MPLLFSRQLFSTLQDTRIGAKLQPPEAGSKFKVPQFKLGFVNQALNCGTLNF
jgi:hypothetical protein